MNAVLDALEAMYPALRGTIRDHVTKKRRAFIRFFACGEDWSARIRRIPHFRRPLQRQGSPSDHRRHRRRVEISKRIEPAAL